MNFALSVLERLARRYGTRPGLYGIEVLNEPISFLVYRTSGTTGKAKDKQEAKGSRHVPLSFLKEFYRRAYRTLRAVLPADKVIVFHDGFRLSRWKDFFGGRGWRTSCWTPTSTCLPWNISCRCPSPGSTGCMWPWKSTKLKKPPAGPPWWWGVVHRVPLSL